MRILLIFGILALVFLKAHGKLEWWQTMSLYQIYPRSFKDGDGDGIGDLKGIESKLDHLAASKVDAFWISPIYPSPMVDFGYDISDFKGIDPMYGTLEDFKNMMKKAHNLSIKVLLDFVPNHSSDKHEWFQKSVKKIEPYTDYYVWQPGKIVNGKRQPPNNWLGTFYTPAWTWNEERQAYYYHQFLPEQPDLNFRNERVVEEIKNVMRFWLDLGVDGFRVDAVPHLLEDKSLKDEPVSGKTNDTLNYAYLDHIYTNGIPETYEMVRKMRDVIDEYETKNSSRIIVLEAYADKIQKVMDYFKYGANFPFNFGLIGSINQNSSAKDVKAKIDEWLDNVPAGGTSNWVAGNHDNSRLATRFGRKLAPAVMSMVQLLPGVAITYNGDEIGMEDTWLSWEETVDPQGCNSGKENYEKMSRDPVRTPFQWDSSVSAGFSSNPKTWLPVNKNYKELNLAAQKVANTSYYKNFLKITDLRKLPVIKQGSVQTMLLNDNVFAFSRDLKGEKSIYVIINFGYKAEIVSLKAFENAPAQVKLYVATTLDTDTKDGETRSTDGLRIAPRSGSIFVSSAD